MCDFTLDDAQANLDAGDDVNLACLTNIDILLNPLYYASIMYREVARLREREAQAIKLINAAFGEYVCGFDHLMNTPERTAWEKNFAVPARRFLFETRAYLHAKPSTTHKSTLDESHDEGSDGRA